MTFRSSVLLSVVLSVSSTAIAADLFYEQRLQAGKAALAAKQYVDADVELRIAAFGLLDEPKRLSEALALLALAQSSMNRTEDLATTLRRFVETETRFDTWDGDVLEPAQRRQFETLLIRSVPKASLAAVSSLAPLVAPPPDPEPPARASRATPRRRATTDSPTAQPRAPQPAPAQPVTTTPATATPARPSSTVTQRTTRQSLDEATKLVSARRYADAVSILSEAVGRDTSNRELRLTLMQAAALASNWAVAAAQVPLISPFSDNESVAMFYAAITLFETNQFTEARRLLSRALPRLNRSPYVDEYAAKINGAGAGR